MSGVTLFDVAEMAAHLPPDSAVARALNPDHLWTTEAMLLAAAVDGMRDLHFDTLRHWGVKGLKRPDPIERPGVKVKQAETEVVGASAGFETFDDADRWYEEHFPGRLTTPQRRLPSRDSRGRFTKT